MTEFTNEYFREMERVGEEYEKARAVRRAEKEELIKKGDWDGVKECTDREENFPFPFSAGAMKAYWAWKNSIEHETDFFEVRELPWEKDALDFIVCLKEAGVSEFAITDESTSLMDLLHAFGSIGCRIEGLCTVLRTENNWGTEERISHNGIKMSI